MKGKNPTHHKLPFLLETNKANSTTIIESFSIKLSNEGTTIIFKKNYNYENHLKE
jgi:hypothetical protein